MFAETCPQYLFMTRHDLDKPGTEGAKWIFSPPARDASDQPALWQALALGDLQVISSDHAPYRYDKSGKLMAGRKPNFKQIPNGMPGLEARLPMVFDEMVTNGRFDVNKFVAWTATNPAQIYGLYPKKGTIAIGSDADIAIWDPKKSVTFQDKTVKDRAGFTPWKGRTVKGWPTTVLLRGEVLVSDRQAARQARQRAIPGTQGRQGGRAARPSRARVRSEAEFWGEDVRLLWSPGGRANTRMADVQLAGVSKNWGAAAAVDNVSFSAPAGHLVALLGPSGCGKSTTLRLIAGLETASAGTIRIADREVTALPPARRGVSMVFQNYALFPHLSVAENILFGLKVRDVPKAERTERLKRAAGILGLEALLERKPSQLSGGQQQRVALGRAIVARDPRLPDGRAALQSRRPVARRDAARNPRIAAPPRHDHAVRHPRPGRGDDDGGPGGADAQRPHRAGRGARRAVREARHDLRGALRRHAADERRAGDAAAGSRAAERARRPCAGSAGDRHPARGRAARARTACRRPSRRWNISAPTR